MATTFNKLAAQQSRKLSEQSTSLIEIGLRYNKGSMPNIPITYEQLQAHLVSYYLTLQPLSRSNDPVDQKDNQRAVKLLNKLAENNGIKRPKTAMQTLESDANSIPKILSNRSMIQLCVSTFGCVSELDHKDLNYKLICELHYLILDIYTRHELIRQVPIIKKRKGKSKKKYDVIVFEDEYGTLADVFKTAGSVN